MQYLHSGGAQVCQSGLGWTVVLLVVIATTTTFDTAIVKNVNTYVNYNNYVLCMLTGKLENRYIYMYHVSYSP